MSAKMSSSVEISNIQDIKIENGKIVIIGDGVFQSRMVTTEDKKDSKFVIGGQPSSTYVAQGNAVKFSITSYQFSYDQLSEEDKAKHSKDKEAQAL